MKKIYIVIAVASSTCAWAGIDWGILGFPSYNHTAKDALAGFDIKRNGKLSYVFGGQKPNMQPARSSHFSELLAEWDAKGDWQTSRGTLQVLWQRTGTKAPTQGWPTTKKVLSMADLALIYSNPD